MIKQCFICCVFFTFSCYGNETDSFNAEYFYNSQNALGGVGLIQTPTARFSQDGEFTFGVSTESPFNRLYSKVQFFPWLEIVLRYTEGTHAPYGTGMSQTWKDKGLDTKFKLLEESDKFPALAFGINDLGGTGYYGSEYIVANKSFNNLDFTLGLAWGRLAGVDHMSNPVARLFPSQKLRGGTAGLGGSLNIGRFFSGPYTSVFGGIEYLTPIPNLSLKLEYDTSDYHELIGKEKKIYKKGETFEVDSRYNIAFNYRLNPTARDQVDLTLGFIRGNTFYANVAVHSNLNTVSKPKFTPPPELLNEPYLEPFKLLNDDWQKYLSELIIWQMGNVGFVTHKIIFNDRELQAEISQSRFQKPITAIDLASRILANNSPKNIDKITVINIDQGVETLRATIPRNILVNAVRNGPLNEEFIEFNNDNTLNSEAIIEQNDYLYPHFYWDVKPHLLGTLQHQEKFYFWQLEALFHSEFSIRKGLYLTTDIGINIDNNYEDYKYHIPDGALHHVRQDRRLYLTEGESGLRKMSLDYIFGLNPNITAKISMGYLEWMYGGAGGEILYMPDSKHWALGIDAYWVKQREFDQKFSFRDYETITGFITFYYDLPFYDLRFKGSVGKFLGKDKGVNIDLSRRFKTGARIGAIAAFTDCNPACVGEGSFNKWIYFTLPMNLFYQSDTRGSAGYAWSPLTKDAGTKVEPGGLYGLMTNVQDETDSLRRKPWSLKKIVSGFGTTPKTKI